MSGSRGRGFQDFSGGGGVPGWWGQGGRSCWVGVSGFELRVPGSGFRGAHFSPSFLATSPNFISGFAATTCVAHRVSPEAGLSVPRRGCLSRGGAVCPEAELSAMRRHAGSQRERNFSFDATGYNILRYSPSKTVCVMLCTRVMSK